MLALKEADRLVKEGRLEEALEIILRARRDEPGNLYALAYEERVRGLMRRRDDAPAPPHPSAAGTPVPDSPPEEDVSLEARLRDFMARIESLAARCEYALALQEISRAKILAPDDPALAARQREIEEAFAEHRKVLAAERKKADLEARERMKREREEEDRKAADRAARERDDHEKARTEEQERKIREYLTRAAECFDADNLEAAVAELSFVVVLDPSNPELVRLQEAIALRGDEVRRKREQARLQKEERSRKKQEALRDAVRQHLSAARAHADRQEFVEALREIARAYVLEPGNPGIRAEEERILAEQQRSIDEVSASRTEEGERRQREEEDLARQREELERERALAVRRAREAAEQKARREALALHCGRARELLAAGQLEPALGEIALGYVIDPFDAQLKELEREVLAAREAVPPPPPPEHEPDHTREVAELLARAEEELAGHSFASALDTLARALSLDPLNEEIPQRQESVRAEEIRWREEEAVRERQRAREEALERHRAAAESFLAAGSPDEALTEALLGTRVAGNEESFAELRARIEQAIREREERLAAEALIASLDDFMDRTKRTMAEALTPAPPQQPPETPAPAERVSEAAIHIEQAQDLFVRGRFDDALAEVAMGLTLEPENTLLLTLEKEIWRQQGEAREAAAAADPEREQIVRLHILTADEYARRGEIPRALDEIAAAYAADPTNKDVRKAEMRIRQMELHGQSGDGSTLKLVYPRI